MVNLSRRGFLGKCLSTAIGIVAGAPLVKVLTEPVPERFCNWVTRYDGKSLKKEDWIELDQAVLKLTRLQLAKFTDLQFISGSRKYTPSHFIVGKSKDE